MAEVTLAVLLVAAVSMSGCAAEPRDGAAGAEAASFTGIATLKASGDLCIQLRSQDAGAPVAEGYFCYPPSDPQYKSIRAHVGEIRPGEEKAIAPFPQ